MKILTSHGGAFFGTAGINTCPTLAVAYEAGGTDFIYGNLYNRAAQRDAPSYVLRVAELYLIRAEARTRQGKLADALAGIPNSTTDTEADLYWPSRMDGESSSPLKPTAGLTWCVQAG